MGMWLSGAAPHSCGVVQPRTWPLRFKIALAILSAVLVHHDLINSQPSTLPPFTLIRIARLCLPPNTPGDRTITTSRQHMDYLSSLPPELLRNINSRISTISLRSLSLTSRYFNCIVGRVPLSKEETLELRLGLETSDAARYHRVCSKCIRLRQFYHFSLKHASAKTQANIRTCLDCFLKGHNPLNKHQRIRWFLGAIIAVCPNCSMLVRCHGGANPAVSMAPNKIFEHVCKVGREPEPISDDVGDPSVCRLRVSLDRLEAILPRRFLLEFRPDHYRYGTRDIIDLDKALVRLESYAPNEKSQTEDTENSQTEDTENSQTEDTENSAS